MYYTNKQAKVKSLISANLSSIEHTYPLSWGLPEKHFFGNRASNACLENRVIIKDNASVLEIGCGIGGLLIRLSKKYKKGNFFGLDISSEAIHYARRATEKKNIYFVLGDAHELPFEEETFELTYCQTVLMYLSDPIKAIKEMVRVTQMEGKVVALAEGDWKNFSFHPASRAVEQIVNFFLKSIRINGGDPFIGQKLERLFLNAGLTEVKAEKNMVKSQRIAGKELFSNGYIEIAESFLNRSISRGADVPFDAKQVIRELKVWSRIPGSYLVMPRSVYAEGYRKKGNR